MITLGNIMIDCPDDNALQSFYQNLLGWEPFIYFGLPALRNESGLVIMFSAEEDYCAPVWPEEEGSQQKQMHFDFQCDDLEASLAHAEQLGAHRAEQQFGGDDFITMIDPAGHPFCLCRSSNAG